MANELVQVPFHGDVIDATRDGQGNVWVPIRRPCEALGLAPNNQIEKLKGKSWAVDMMIISTGPDGKSYEMFALHLDCLPMWLATIDASRVKKDLRLKLELYQKEAARVLADHFFGRKSSERKPAGDPITAQLQALLAMRQDQLALESRQAKIEARVDEVASCVADAGAVADAALQTVTCNHGYFSVLAYLRRQGRELSVAQASAYGRRLTTICNQAGITVQRVADPRFGFVNIYPESVLRTFFEEN